MTTQCHCGKDGHPLNSVNCPVHGYEAHGITGGERCPYRNPDCPRCYPKTDAELAGAGGIK